jgi:hypothetical protein
LHIAIYFLSNALRLPKEQISQLQEKYAYEYEYEALLELYKRGKLTYSEKNLSQCHFMPKKYQIDWPGIEPGTPR